MNSDSKCFFQLMSEVLLSQTLSFLGQFLEIYGTFTHVAQVHLTKSSHDLSGSAFLAACSQPAFSRTARHIEGLGIEKAWIFPCNCCSVAQDFQGLVKGSLRTN